ncbi:hypothetical protein [Streptomyces sp. NBC_01089]|uniref:hypothetical protein n=1 Tax=Streptomyces sp. NBC_01089 TaxID=2903747 RepID=UPI00386E57C6|nr:hypothetical protein OG510_01880 [Streptomyces sp. NBC_01089]
MKFSGSPDGSIRECGTGRPPEAGDLCVHGWPGVGHTVEHEGIQQPPIAWQAGIHLARNAAGRERVRRISRDETRTYRRDVKIGAVMIVLGAILLIIGLVVGVSLLTTVGGVLVVVGAVLWILGATGRKVGGRKHYF